MESVDRSQRSLFVSSLISIPRNLYPNNRGPRTEYILEHAVYALLEQSEPVTLAALPKLLVDHNDRRKAVKNLTDPAIGSFWLRNNVCRNRLRHGINTLVLALLRWPALKCPRMAGFEVSTEEITLVTDDWHPTGLSLDISRGNLSLAASTVQLLSATPAALARREEGALD